MTQTTGPRSEIGRELTIAELQPQRLVVVAPSYSKACFTMWVEAIDATTVMFFAGELKWHVVNFIKDNRIVDDQGRLIKVFEYLGKV